MRETNGSKIWRNRLSILEGIKNSIFKKEAIEEIASHRYDICKTCSEFDVKGDECTVSGTQPCCASCGCSLKFKTRSLSTSCPKSLWDVVLTEEEELDHEILNPEQDD